MNSYVKARDRLGGLIAEFTIIGGVINQEKTIHVTECLVELSEGKGYFRGLQDASFEQKSVIGRNILKKCLSVMVESARRGLIISDGKFTNFGIMANGEIVLFDLGPGTFLSTDDPEIALSLLQFDGVNGMNMSRLLNLAKLESNEGVVSTIKDIKAVERLGRMTGLARRAVS